MRTSHNILVLFALIAGPACVTASHASPAASQDPAQIRLVEISSQPRPGGGQRVRYTMIQRLQPLAVGAGAAAPGAMVTSGDAVSLSYEQDPGGWLELGTLTVESYGPHGAPQAGIAAVASGDASEASASSAPLVLAIAPVHPDPVRGRALVVDVALPNADAARLELMDIMGRRVAMHELGSLGAGRHSVNLSAGQRFAPGVYLLRLTQGGEARVARVTVVD